LLLYRVFRETPNKEKKMRPSEVKKALTTDSLAHEAAQEAADAAAKAEADASLDEALEGIKTAESLNQLHSALCEAEEEIDVLNMLDDGDRCLSDLVDLTDLPEFGGEEPRATTGGYSWDEEEILMCDSSISLPGQGSGGWYLAPRCPECGAVVEEQGICDDCQPEEGWYADDGNAAVHYPDADSGREAAQSYVDGGDWGDVESTTWIEVRTWRQSAGGDEVEGSAGRHTIALDPKEPECQGGEHDWRSPHSLVGGVEENPGVQGHGGGCFYDEVCRYCGVGRRVDTWATDPETGRQGLVSVEYSDATEESETWAARCAAAAWERKFDALPDTPGCEREGATIRIPSWPDDDGDPIEGAAEWDSLHPRIALPDIGLVSPEGALAEYME